MNLSLHFLVTFFCVVITWSVAVLSELFSPFMFLCFYMLVMERKIKWFLFMFHMYGYLCREVLQGQGYFGLVLAFGRKLLDMDW